MNKPHEIQEILLKHSSTGSYGTCIWFTEWSSVIREVEALYKADADRENDWQTRLNTTIMSLIPESENKIKIIDLIIEHNKSKYGDKNG